ncbi:MAG: neocarzinostatin apoprotein domain-containing protein [Acidimicrobiales bacterium]
MTTRGARAGRAAATVLVPAAVTLAALATGVVPAWAGAGPGTGKPARHAVGELTETYVDTHRATPAWGQSPRTASRTLVTTVLYPAAGTPTGASGGTPVAGAAPDRRTGPYPLVVFGHGLGSTPEAYLPLLQGWASAGFVVAAPRFPLSSSETPGGPDAADVVHQPGDMSYVIGAVLRASAAATGPLSGLVDPHEIGAAGHSNGAITTLGLVADTCCRDPRVKAAVVMAGTTEGMPGGHYDLAGAPPTLLVHDTTDPIVPYRSAVVVYNALRGPKGLLTLRGSTSPALAGTAAHMAASGVVGPTSSIVVRTTTAFFDAYLRGDRAARQRIVADGTTPFTTIHADLTPGGGARLPVPPAPVVHLKATASPSTGLVDGQTVTVRWHGYTAGKVVNVLECSRIDLATASSAGCDFSNADILHPDPTGSGSLQMQVVSGAVGDGTCNATHTGCSIVVNNASSTDPSETVKVPITFAT